MHRTARRLALVTLMLATVSVAAPAPSAAVERSGVRMELLIDGRPAAEHRARGTRYVRAYRNKEYAVRLTNDTDGRVAVALSVDGLNSVDAKHTSARDATKWVLGPWESIVVQGWQVGPAQARKFFFTTEEKSYGDWLGDTRNLGVISAVAFCERRRAVTVVTPAPEPEPWYRRWGMGDDADAGAAGKGSAREGRAEEAPATADASSQSAGSTSRRRGAERKSSSGYRPAPSKPKPDDHAATGIGRRVRNDVEWVDFDLDPKPLAELNLRYGFRDELVALGVLPQRRYYRENALTRRENAGGFAPDPGR